MNNDSRLTESRTASAVTIASRPNVAAAGIRFQSACAAKNVAKRMAIAAASSAFAVAGYFLAAFSSQSTSSEIATRIPISTRTGGCSQPCCTE